ncbi:uncharacterized protein LOC129220340 [Uloborus diversus]|uniref:uncharacterized protein LOC129220340 n=1 Tax=Uloborus diversus TaxID=327109 RepID=UPI0024091FD4|nr:uncharacterized protein LOC129220340 [Uloborus diversus]
MTYVRHYGRPDLFVTFTCNPKWEEIQILLLPGQESIHRHDIVARVFKQKLKSLIDLIVKHSVFGNVCCWLYSIEWQKRGLPHAHILVWLEDKIRPEEIDQIISAEIPNPLADPELFEIVTNHMIHGPCGAFNMTSPCMEDGKCKKRFPKQFTNDTITDIDGYPLYRRRNAENGGNTYSMRMSIFANYVELDNRWVVPYSPLLSKTYKAHINVEYCSSVRSIKYICKYVNKSSDLAVFEVRNINKNDKLTRYQMGRYISSNEAIWHIFSFPIHERDPSVQHLAVHLENGQRVYFTEENILQRALEPPKTTLTEFFTLCQKSDNSQKQYYIPIFHAILHGIKSGKNGNHVNKEHNIHQSLAYSKPRHWGDFTLCIQNNANALFLCLLFVNIPGPTSFEFLRTVNGQVFNTYQDACRELQLLDAHNHWDLTLADAALTSTPNNIRQLFAIILTTCYPTQSLALREKYKNYMTDNILHRVKQIKQCPNLDFTPYMHNEALVLIEDLCILISHLPLSHYGMPSPDRLATDLVNTDLQREKQYNAVDLATIIANNEPLLTVEQKNIYNQVMLTVDTEQGGFFFLRRTRWNRQDIFDIINPCKDTITTENRIGNCIIRHCCHFVRWWANSTFCFEVAIRYS